MATEEGGGVVAIVVRCCFSCMRKGIISPMSDGKSGAGSVLITLRKGSGVETISSRRGEDESSRSNTTVGDSGGVSEIKFLV